MIGRALSLFIPCTSVFVQCSLSSSFPVTWKKPGHSPTGHTGHVRETRGTHRIQHTRDIHGTQTGQTGHKRGPHGSIEHRTIEHAGYTITHTGHKMDTTRGKHTRYTIKHTIRSTQETPRTHASIHIRHTRGREQMLGAWWRLRPRFVSSPKSNGERKRAQESTREHY